MVTLRSNGAEGRGDAHGFSLAYHGEAGAAVSIRYMGDPWGVISVVSGGNAVDNELHRETEGDRITVGTVAANIQSMRRK